MKALFDFICKQGTVTERYIDNSIEQVDCDCCGDKAKKVTSPPSYFKIDGFRADINTEKWAKAREQNSKRVRANEG